MYRKVWEQSKASVCAIDFYSHAGTKITTFTGFKIKDFLITDDVVDKFRKPAEVLIRFAGSEKHGSACIQMCFEEFIKTKVKLNGDLNPGYVLFDINHPIFKDIPSLRCSKRMNYSIGHPIAILGYQLDQENLAIKAGIISSLHKQADGFNTIQVDCTIKQGNAGSPLIDVENMEVIGIIGHRLASIARSYRAMMRIINTNLQVLKEAEGKINMEDIDPIQVLIANQNQIKHLATDFFKTTNMRVGFAVELCNIADYCPDREEDLGTIDMESKRDT